MQQTDIMHCAHTASDEGGAQTPSRHARRGGADGADLDIREGDVRVGFVVAQPLRRARVVPRARATGNARRRARLVRRESRVEPEHVHLAVVPEREDEHHASVQRCAHALQL